MAFLTDSSSFARTLTAVGDARSSARAKFGSTGLRLNQYGATPPSTGYGVTVPSSADFNFTGQFTVEGWFYFDVLKTVDLITRWSSTAAQCQFTMGRDATNLWFAFNDTGGVNRNTFGAWAPTVSAWYHIAADRDAAGMVRIYVDGVVKASASFPQAWRTTSTRAIAIGYAENYGDSNYLHGSVDEVRISNVARYAGAFVPSASAFTSDANTLLLAHFEDVPATAQTSKLVSYAVTGGAVNRASLSKAVGYAVTGGSVNQASLSKLNAYAVTEFYGATKLNGYVVAAPGDGALTAPKIVSYAVINSGAQLITKITGYAVLDISAAVAARPVVFVCT